MTTSLMYTLMQHLFGSVTQQTPPKEEMVVASNQFEENEQALTELLKILSEYIGQGQTQQLEKRLQILCANDPPLSSDSDIQRLEVRLRKLYSGYKAPGIEIPEVPADLLERLSEIKEDVVVASNQFEEIEQALTERLKILSEYIDQGQTQQLEERLQILCANDPPISSDPDIQRLEVRLRKLYSGYKDPGIEIPEVPADFLERLQLKNDIVTTISMVENLVVFIIETSPEKTAAFLQQIAHVLSPEQRTLVFEIIKDRLLDLIRSSDDFVKITRVLSPEQRIIVFDSIKSRLPQLANTYVGMREISTYLALGERAQVYPHNWYFLLEILDNMGIRDERDVKDRNLKQLAVFVVMQAAVLAVIKQDPILGLRQALAGAGGLAFFLPVVQESLVDTAKRAQVYTKKWYFMLSVMATPLAQGAAAVVMVAAAAAIITQEPMMVVQTAVAATAGFATVGFFSRKKPDPTMDEAFPNIGLGN